MIQIAEQAASRLKQSTHGRTVVELALVRIAALDELDDIAGLVEQVGSGAGPSGAPPAAARAAVGPVFSAAPAVKKNDEPGAGVAGRIEAPARPEPARPAAVRPTSNGPASERAVSERLASHPSSAPAEVGPQSTTASSAAARRGTETSVIAAAPSRAVASEGPAAVVMEAPEVRRPTAGKAAPAVLSDDQAEAYWKRAADEFPDMLNIHSGMCHKWTVAGPGKVVAHFPKKYHVSKVFCERPEQLSRLEKAISALAGGSVRIEMALSDEPEVPVQTSAKTGPAPHERLREKSQQPFVRKALELFDARPLRVEEGE
jgi:DNA polymerase-3 subunit gamma/tau